MKVGTLFFCLQPEDNLKKLRKKASPRRQCIMRPTRGARQGNNSATVVLSVPRKGLFHGVTHHHHVHRKVMLEQWMVSASPDSLII